MKRPSRISNFSSSSDLRGLKLDVPKDGGWGWLVVVGSFFCNLIVDGITNSFGIFYIEFLEYFGGSRAETASVGGMVKAIYLLMGPVASALINVYGCKKVAMMGALISASGFIFSTFAKSLYQLHLTFGLMVGIGFGMIYLPSVIIISSYFFNKRSVATGIVCCGSGVGSAIMPILLKCLIETYNWEGAALIEAGIVLNVIVFSSLYRPLHPRFVTPACIGTEVSVEWDKVSELQNLYTAPKDWSGKQFNHNICQSFESLGSGNSSLVSFQDTVMLSNENTTKYPLPGYADDAKDKQSSGNMRRSRSLSEQSSTCSSLDKQQSSNFSSYSLSSTHQIQSSLIAQSTESSGDNECYTAHHKDASRHLSRQSAPSFVFSKLASRLSICSSYNNYRDQRRHTWNQQLTNQNMYQNFLEVSSPTYHRKSSCGLYVNAPLYRKDIFYSGNIYSVASTWTESDIYSQMVSTKTTFDCFSPVIKDVLLEMLDVSVMKDTHFRLFCISNFMTSLCSIVPYVYLPERADRSGVPITQTALLLAIMGVTDTVSRLVFGWLANTVNFNKLTLYAVAVTVHGFITASSSLTSSYLSLCLYAVSSGALFGIQVTFMSLVLVDLNGLDRLSNSFGLVLMFRGVASLAGTLLAGYIVDATGSYPTCFAVAGGILVVGGAILWAAFYLHRQSQKRREFSADEENKRASDVKKHNITITLSTCSNRNITVL